MVRYLAALAIVSLCSLASALPPAASNYVAVSYDPTGQILTLNGDAAANSIQITASGNTVMVKAGSPTRLGTASSNVTSLSFKTGVNLSIKANMGGGSDLVVINGLSVRAGDFDLGAGDDVLTFTGCRLGVVTVNGGPGADAVRLVNSLIGSLSWVAVESVPAGW